MKLKNYGALQDKSINIYKNIEKCRDLGGGLIKMRVGLGIEFQPLLSCFSHLFRANLIIAQKDLISG